MGELWAKNGPGKGSPYTPLHVFTQVWVRSGSSVSRQAQRLLGRGKARVVGAAGASTVMRPGRTVSGVIGAQMVRELASM